MVNQTLMDNYRAHQALLSCPVCRRAGRVVGASFKCKKGHSYDLSARGYLNFGIQRRSSHYSRALFESRQAVLSAGLFAQAAQEIDRAVAGLYTGAPLTLLDAGCGEGYFTRALGRRWVDGRACRMLALDIERDAVQIACRQHRGICWLVADLNRMPVADHCVDVLLNILSPANYSEFARVLRPGGSLIKVVPGERHLAEIRDSIAGQLRRQETSGDRVADHFRAHLPHSRRVEVCYRWPVPDGLAEHLYRMTPLTAGKDLSGIDFAALEQVTVHLALLIGAMG